MKSKIYNGDLKLGEVAATLANFFNRGPLTSSASLEGERAFVQISTRPGFASGGRTNIGISLHQTEGRLEAQVGDQSVLGLAGSLGASALLAWLNPLNLLGRLDDIAADIENLTLEDQVWKVLDRIAAEGGASQQLSERMRRMVCPYCGTANKVGEGRCVACGAPLGDVQPNTCPKCGYVLLHNESKCPNCGTLIQVQR
jgi:DNA-directed RNA polymerase subunit RPC12/RpoP